MIYNWRADAACADYDPEMWFPTPGNPRSGADSAAAMRICHHACPVRLECLTWALRHNEDHGIWGGLTAQDRRTLTGKTGRKPRKPRTPPVVDADVYASTGI